MRAVVRFPRGFSPNSPQVKSRIKPTTSRHRRPGTMAGSLDLDIGRLPSIFRLDRGNTIVKLELPTLRQHSRRRQASPNYQLEDEGVIVFQEAK